METQISSVLWLFLSRLFQEAAAELFERPTFLERVALLLEVDRCKLKIKSFDSFS